MIRKFFTFTILILVICSLSFFENQESRAESVINKDTLAIHNSQANFRVREGENYTEPRSRVNSQIPERNFPMFESYDPTIIVGDGFNKGKILGYWSGRKIRSSVCAWLSLECTKNGYTEYE
jgi:hypothetical protein